MRVSSLTTRCQVGADPRGGVPRRQPGCVCYAKSPGRWRCMANAIETTGLMKSFGKTRALAGLDLSIREGTVFGLLGPNGAGKTTLIRILATLLRPSAGTATVLGHDVVRDAKTVRQKVSLTG